MWLLFKQTKHTSHQCWSWMYHFWEFSIIKHIWTIFKFGINHKHSGSQRKTYLDALWANKIYRKTYQPWILIQGVPFLRILITKHIWAIFRFVINHKHSKKKTEAKNRCCRIILFQKTYSRGLFYYRWKISNIFEIKTGAGKLCFWATGHIHALCNREQWTGPAQFGQFLQLGLLVVKHTNVVAVLQAHCSHSLSITYVPTTT